MGRRLLQHAGERLERFRRRHALRHADGAAAPCAAQGRGLRNPRIGQVGRGLRAAALPADHPRLRHLPRACTEASALPPRHRPTTTTTADPLARLCVRPGLLHPVHLGLLVPRRARRRPRQEQVRRRRLPRQRSGGDQARRHVGAGLFERNLCVKRSQCNSQLHS